MTTAHPWTRSSPFLPHCQPRYVHLNNPQNAMPTNPSPPSTALATLHHLIATLLTAAPPALHPQIQQILRYLGKSA